MSIPQTYRVTGRRPSGITTYDFMCVNSTAAYWIAKEFWPELEIIGVRLLDEWQDAPTQPAYA